ADPTRRYSENAARGNLASLRRWFWLYRLLERPRVRGSSRQARSIIVLRSMRNRRRSRRSELPCGSAHLRYRAATTTASFQKGSVLCATASREASCACDLSVASLHSDQAPNPLHACSFLHPPLRGRCP